MCVLPDFCVLIGTSSTQLGLDAADKPHANRGEGTTACSDKTVSCHHWCDALQPQRWGPGLGHRAVALNATAVHAHLPPGHAASPAPLPDSSAPARL